MVMISAMTGSLMAYIYESYPTLPVTTVQLVMALPALIGIFSSFASGSLALKYSKKNLLLICAVTNLFYFVVFAVFGVSGPFWILLAAAGISGISRGASVTLMNLLISDFMGPERSASYMAVIGAVLQAGAAIAGVLGGLIGAVGDGAYWNYAFYLGILIIPSMIIFAKLMPKSPENAAASIGGHKNNSATAPAGGSRIPAKVYFVGVLLVLYFISASAYLLNISFYIISENELGTSADAGFVNFVCTAMGVFVGIFYNRFAKLFKSWNMPICYFLTAVSFAILIIFSNNIIGAYVASLLLGIGFSLTVPYNTVYFVKITPPKLMPIAVAFVSGSMNLGMFVAPMVLNSIGEMLGSGTDGIFKLAAAIALICTIGSIFIFPMSEKRNSVAI